MNQPERRETETRTDATNQQHRGNNILWKTLWLSSDVLGFDTNPVFDRIRVCERAEKKRPVRGDNRTGQAIWALGVDGRSRLI
jgi:hypothetical protein